MGLFDNLFLDKNTPMAINIGDPLGSETTQNAASSNPGAAGGGGGGGGGSGSSTGGSGGGVSGGTGGNGDGSVSPGGLSGIGTLGSGAGSGGGSSTLSTTSIPGMSYLPTGVMMNGGDTPPGGASIAPVNEVTFDIGGDLGFSNPMETAGNMPQTQGEGGISLANPLIDTSAQPAFIVSEVPVQSGNISIDPMANIPAMNTIPENTLGDVTALTTPLSVAIPPDSGILEINPITEISASSIPSIESPLMNLMSGFDKAPETPAIYTLNSPAMPAPTPVTDTTSTDGIFSLMDTATAPDISETITPAPAVDTSPIASIMPLDENVHESMPLNLIENVPSEESNIVEKSEGIVDSHPMNVIGKELARMTRSPRLQGKLNGFIGELEELSVEEERLKDEKRKQIASYQTRIAELKTEYETRIHALELEEEDLKKQIIVMDEERAHITQVIYGFKQELDVV